MPLTQNDLDQLAEDGVNLQALYRRAGLNSATMRSKRRKGNRQEPTPRDSQALLGALSELRAGITCAMRKARRT